MENALFIMLGWVLGLFSPLLIESIQKPSRRMELRRSIFIEIEELRHKLALLAFVLARRNGTLNEELLKWLEPIYRSFKRNYPDDPSSDLVQSWLCLSKKELEASFQSPPELEADLSMKKYTLPFLTSQIPSLSLFSSEFQRLALDIRAYLSMLNEEIDTAWFNYTKTFDSSLSSDNHAIVRKNLVNSYRIMGIMCREIVGKIGDLLKRNN